MRAYIYQGALLCEDCGVKTQHALVSGVIYDPAAATINMQDSNDFPQGPYPNGGGEADLPQYCDSCNTFLENPLTDDGRRFLKRLFHAPLNPGVRAEVPADIWLWAEFYEVPRPHEA